MIFNDDVVIASIVIRYGIFFFFFLIEDWKKVKSLIKARSEDSQFSIEFVSKRRIIVP